MLLRLCLPLLCLLATAAVAQPFALRDDRGQELRFAGPAQRVVSLLPSLTEAVAALGAQQRLVGVDQFSNWPPAVATLPRLGGLEDARIEAIVALRPDVVLASTSARALDRLEALGLKVLRLRSDSHADVRRSLELIARLLGRPEAAAPLWQRIEAELDQAAAALPRALRGQTVYFEIGGGPYAAGRASFIGQTLERLGLPNIVPESLGPFPKLNPEYVVRARPGIVMGTARESAAYAVRPGWAALPAIRQRRVCGFAEAEYELLIRPGPRLGEAARTLVDCLKALPE